MAAVKVISLSDNWPAHILMRLKSAVDLGLIKKTAVPALDDAIVFLPDECNMSQKAIEPDTSGASIVSDKNREASVSGWVKRLDSFNEASDYIKKGFLFTGTNFLFCEAGLCRKGDKVLAGVPHVLLNDNPLLYSDGNSAKSIEQVLKKSRALRLLGVIVHMESKNLMHQGESLDALKGDHLAFVCDALDADSLVICPLK